MAISNVSSGLRPGVCSSTTRPQAPFEGQMIYETDTNRVLVWDNAAWVMIADTDQPPGLQLVGNGVFTNVASFDVVGFSSDYENYQFVMNIGGHSGVAGVTAQLFQGATVRNANYYGQQFLTTYTGTTGVFNTRNNAANFAFPDCTVVPKTLVNANISGVGNGVFNINHVSMDNANVGAWFGGYSNYAATNSFDRIRITGSQNVTGSWYLYGLRK
jgi:hypothetical protein